MLFKVGIRLGKNEDPIKGYFHKGSKTTKIKGFFEICDLGR